MKREDYISWDEYFMGIAILAARRSKDPNTPVGALLCGSSQKKVTASVLPGRQWCRRNLE